MFKPCCRPTWRNPLALQRLCFAAETFLTPTALIRMALAYAVSDLSLKDVAAWASALDVAQSPGRGYFIVCAKPKLAGTRVGTRCLRTKCRKRQVDGLYARWTQR